MNRIKPDKRAPALRHIHQHGAEIAKIADPPVFFRAQGVELNACAPQLLPGKQRLWLIAAFRRDDDAAMGAQLALGQSQRVIPLRQPGWKVKRFTADGMPFVLHALFGASMESTS